jgi:hypothetical protein
MSKLFQPLPVDPDDDRRLDAEFEREFAAGTIPKLNVPPVDPATDPFGRNYSWMKPPSDPFGKAFDVLANLNNDELLKTCGSKVRAIATGGGFPAGTDDAVMRGWALNNFPALCVASGPNGEDLLETLHTGLAVGKGLIAEIEDVLAGHPGFATLSVDERVATAILIAKAYEKPE